MPVTIAIPTALRAYTGGAASVAVEAATVAAALDALVLAQPAIGKHLRDDAGRLRSFVNVYLNDEDVRFLDGKDGTALKEGDQLVIVPSIAGGSPAENGAPRDLPPLDAWEIARYSRHLILDEVGMEGQRRLKAGSVLCVGTGGLGSPLLMYLACAGVGRIGIVDFDTVDESNLQRQIIHGTSAVGHPKIASARARVLDLNPRCRVDSYETALDSSNALDILRPYDVVVDGTDNFPTRYLVNDACVLLDKPNVYGSIFKFEGQASVFNFEGGPHYRDLYPEPPPPGLVPSCAEGGVLGILPGVIGCIQATETIKILLGRGTTLSGRLLLYDALSMKFRELRLRKDPNCPKVEHLIDYHQFCGVPRPGAPVEEPAGALFRRLGAREVKAQLDAGWKPFVLDVRKPHEANIVRFGWADLLRPHEQVVAGNFEDIPRGREILVHCKSGGRSAQAARALAEAGYGPVTNLEGGITAWAKEVEPGMPTY